jgi:protein-S-isoprenylcysteine O-methyltransferase Ste14
VASLKARAWLSLAILDVIIAVVLFGFAGTLRYWHGWVYLLLMAGLSAIITLDLMRRDPALLERRLKGGPTAERRPIQRLIMVGTTVCSVAMLIVPALDFRYKWSSVPLALVVLGNILFVVGFAFIARVYHENTFTSATVGVMEGQRVISTGPYAMVRHPMYASGLLYLLGTPLALGSYWGLIPFGLMVPLLITRLLDEERMLVDELPGYDAYRLQVRHRLLPFLW